MDFEWATNSKFYYKEDQYGGAGCCYELLENAQGEVVVNENKVRQLIQKELSAIEGVKVDSLDKREGIDEMIRDYAVSFKSMVRLGFISMDLDEEGNYHVIATPIDHKVPEKVLRLLPVVGEGVVPIVL